MVGFFIILAASIAQHASADEYNRMPDQGASMFAKSSTLIGRTTIGSYDGLADLADLTDADLMSTDDALPRYGSCQSEDCSASAAPKVKKPFGMRSSSNSVEESPDKVIANLKLAATLAGKFLMFLAIVAVFDHVKSWMYGDGEDVACVACRGSGERSKSADTAMNAQDTWGCTALHHAAESSDSVQDLLQRGADVHARDAWDETPLFFAARAGQLHNCKLLIAKGADINAANADGHTPLIIAANKQMQSVCELLLDNDGHANGIADEQLPPMLSGLLVIRMFANIANP